VNEKLKSLENVLNQLEKIKFNETGSTSLIEKNATKISNFLEEASNHKTEVF
jgi:hypothetical protein